MGVKSKARPINTIIDLKKVNSKTIQIIFIEKNETKKVIVYECLTVDNCSEIMAKITFLRVSSIESNIFIEKPGEASASEENAVLLGHDAA